MRQQPRKEISLTKAELGLIEDRLLTGVVSRAGVLSFLFAIIYALYGLTSFPFLKHFAPNLQLAENLWPRLLFNALPMVAMAIYFRDYKTNVRFKLWLAILGFPLVFMIACMIHVWPLVWAGNTEVYLYVHCANIFVMTMTFIMLAAPPRFLLAQIMAFLAFFVLPLVFIIYHVKGTMLLNLVLGDLLLAVPAASYTSYFIYKLRHKIARFDVQIKNATTPFLGSALAHAIYTNRTDLLQSRKADAVVVMMDIRGFTNFHQTGGQDVVRAFMNDYHQMVSRHVGRFGGYWHKSVGDAQLASFGAMDDTANLDDIPGIGEEVSVAKNRKKNDQFHKSLRALFAITADFEAMKLKYDVTSPMSLGIGVTYGPLEIRIQGDQTHKKELDIDGDVVIRASRLEAYSKIVRKKVAPSESVLILSPELADVIPDERVFQKWSTATDELRVPNYPSLDFVHFHVFKHGDERRNAVLSLMAS